ncbi:flagellar hook-length control protein FliK [Paucibacter sp. PLA-PC-4]|uniref:flagellar hook-length control protein FliK n=1 Tax=Paucibacter sp. PLA-PC-4 TaxID=2993655 RepID=UPI00224B7C4D|nr:flagellar hook-length control protein FliK [Paucibacter sp. PLA-PC-4]MCX2863824.1 flagellar hook-length control protein FliK [Paucibacter sp. PLA-PC-4]
MNSLSTNTPFLGLGGSGKPPAVSGNSPLLSASANDVAASFSELLRGSSAKPAAMTPPVEPQPPAPQAPSRPVTPPKADAGPTQAQSQAKIDRANSQERETLARQNLARGAQARSEAAAGRNAERVAKPETAKVKDGKAAADGKDSVENPLPTLAPAEAATETETEPKTAQLAEPAMALTLTAQPLDTKANKISVAEEGKTDARGATAKSGKAQLADIGGHAAGGAATGGTASAASATAQDTAAAAAIALEGMQASAAKPAALASAGNAAPSFEAVMNAAQAQLAKGGIDVTGPAAASAPAARLELTQPLHSTAFGPEMAARLSLLAADGVQQAQLHLNPAEMGPVSVQIVVEGQQAQISFHSDQADTRAVLENSLPELAAALRESGLTLSGGGVFQQARNPEEQAQPADGHPRGGARAQERAEDSAVPVSTPVRTTASRGVLDLYA